MEKETSKIEVRDVRNGDWYWVSRTVLEDYAAKIGAVGLALYNAYASYVREKGSAFPSQKTISKRLGISLKTIRKYNRILIENGLIKIESGRRIGKSNVITLLKMRGRKQLPRGCELSSYPGGEEVPTKENNIKENTNVESKDSSVKEIFDYFRNEVRAVRGFDPEMSWGKDGRLTKLRLKKYTQEQIKKLIDWYLGSNFSERLGISLATCLSTYVVNLWKSGMASQPHYPIWKPS